MAQRQISHLKRRVILLVCLSVITGVIWLGYQMGIIALGPDDHPGLAKLTEAKARWAINALSRYQMVLEHTGNSNPCEVEAEIQDEVVIRIIRNPCNLQDIPTVSTLFKQLEHEMKTVWWINGMGCNVMAVYVMYDAHLGYPQAIEYRQEWASPTNVPPSAYRVLQTREATGGMCTLLLVFKGGIIVKSLTPLPRSVLI